MFVGCAPAILRPSGLLSALRPQDVFATSLYTGTGASRSIVNGLDMAGRGGLTWTKKRSAAGNNAIVDTIRGGSRILYPNTTGAEVNSVGTITSFNANGYTLGNDDSDFNANGATYVNWSLLFAPKVCVEVTYTGDGTSGRVIPHALGIKPGMIIVKRRDVAGNWGVWHTSATGNLFLNLTDAQSASNTIVLSADSNSFTVGNTAVGNTSGGTYVAYLFAHDPDTTNGIVQFGSFTTAADQINTAVNVELGWRPQLALIKASGAAGNWFIVDDARGWVPGTDNLLSPNTNAAEGGGNLGEPYATGFIARGGAFAASTAYVFMAIRAPI